MSFVEEVKESDLYSVLNDDELMDELSKLGEKIKTYPWDSPLDKNVALHLVVLINLMLQAMLNTKKVLDKHLV